MAGGKMGGKDLGLLILRVALGGIMMTHGIHRSIGPGIQDLSDKLAEMLLPYPPQLAIAVIAALIGGGALVLLGIFAPVGALAIAAVMVGAIVKVSGPNGFFLKLEADKPGDIAHGCEYNVALLAMALCILFAGAGSISLLPRKKKPET